MDPEAVMIMSRFGPTLILVAALAAAVAAGALTYFPDHVNAATGANAPLDAHEARALIPVPPIVAVTAPLALGSVVLWGLAASYADRVDALKKELEVLREKNATHFRRTVLVALVCAAAGFVVGVFAPL